MKTTAFYHASPAHLLVILFALQTLDYHLLFAQRYLTTFGRTMTIKTGNQVHHIITGDFNGDSKADVAIVGDNEITIKFRDTSGWRTNSLIIERPVLDAAVAKLNRDKRDDLLVILDNPFGIRSYVSTAAGKMRQVWNHRFDIQFEKILIADINNDGLEDILLYGKKQLGVTVLRGMGNGTFRRDTTIFPDNSFNALLIARINDDDMNDLIAANWISNDLMIFTGYGKLKFSDPQIVRGSSEPKYFKVATIDSDDVPDLIVAYPDEHLIKIFHGDGFGGFQISQSILLHDEILGIDIADVNQDGHPDLGILTGNGFYIELNNGKGELVEEVEFSAGMNPAEFTFLLNSASGQTSAAILDTIHSSVRILYSAHADIPTVGDDCYGTGALPGGVLSLDFHHNGSEDLILPNSQSRTVSLFLETNDGRYNGQIVFESSTPVQYLRYVSTTDTEVTLIGYSSIAESIAVIGISTLDYSHHILTLPTQGTTDLLYVRQDTATRHLHLFTLERGEKSNQGNIPIQFMEYEQISPTRFIERTYSSLSQYPLLTATMSYIDNDAYPDLIYAIYNPHHRQIEIDLARGTALEQYSFSRQLGTLGIDSLSSAFLWYSDINGDHIPDLILTVGEPQNTLYTFLGKKDSTYSAPTAQFIGEMSITARDDLQVLPQPNGRREDIVILNSLTRMLQLYHTRENGMLLPAARLLSTEGVGGYLYMKDLNDQTTRLIISDRNNGYLRIISVENLK